VDERPELAGKQAVGPDGRVEMGPAGGVRIEGQPLTEVVRRMADQARVAPSSVHVQVAEFNSQKLYLFGEVNGLQRAIPYRGPETLLEMLQRVGGITAGAAPNDVYVVRTEVADGKQPEVFHIALKAIILEHDQRTNIHLQPFDQVYIGETRQSSVSKCVAPCLKPLLQTLCGLHRKGTPPLPPDSAVAQKRESTPGRLTLPPWLTPRRPGAGEPPGGSPPATGDSIPVPLPPPRRVDS
jgi:protein involved in polysaccharide export with SLBB domain